MMTRCTSLPTGRSRAEVGATFDSAVQGLHAEQLLGVVQLERLQVGGHIDMNLSVRGSAEAPIIEGEIQIDGPQVWLDAAQQGRRRDVVPRP